jgi:DNA invertase Pin-like site-specific DNA recombinase
MIEGHFGYGRVSTDDQNPDLQDEALKRAGLDSSHIFFDVESGTQNNRREYQKLIRKIIDGQVKKITVNRIDRLGRDHYELIYFFKLVEDHNVELVSLCEPFVKDWNKSAWAFRATWDTIGDARYELLRLKERQRQGIDAKKDPVTGKAMWKGRGKDKKPRKEKILP